MAKPTQLEIRLFPQSEDEFPTAQHLRNWLDNDLRCRGGYYRVISTARYGRLNPGDVVVFHRAGELVGDALLLKGLEPLRPFDRIGGQTYRGQLVFDPKTIRIYPRTMKLKEFTRTTGRDVNPQTLQYLSSAEYDAILEYVRR